MDTPAGSCVLYPALPPSSRCPRIPNCRGPGKSDGEPGGVGGQAGSQLSEPRPATAAQAGTGMLWAARAVQEACWDGANDN